jgi:phosphohistidine phosphatase
MRQLILIRHASASAGALHGGDYERPLDAKGNEDAAEMGRRLAGRGLRADLVLSSAAARALATARAIVEGIGYLPDEVESDEDLYCASAEKLLGTLQEIPDTVDHAVLVAHNPGISELAAWLTGEPAIALPTCAVVRIEIDVGSWAGVGRGGGVQMELLRPE